MTTPDEMKIPTLTQLGKHPISVIFMTLGLSIGSVWAFYRPALIADLSADFFTVALAETVHQEIKDTMNDRMDTLEDKVDDNSIATKSLQTEFRLTAAFQLENSIKINLESHQAQLPENRDANWGQDVGRLKRRLVLATDYKECVLYERPNCELLQRQLYQ